MKKIILILASILIMFGIMSTPAFASDKASESGYIVSKEIENTVVTITGTENIERYQESLGEEYDPNLIAVIRNINDSYANESIRITPYFIDREYYIKNKRTSRYTDFGDVLRSYIRPAGRISINEEIEITTSFTADAGISEEILELSLGFSVSSTDTFQIEWSGEYSYPVKIFVYPIYEKITGEVWDDDVHFDDFVGNLEIQRAIGDDIRVYRR